jgi:hypothetical protein
VLINSRKTCPLEGKAQGKISRSPMKTSALKFSPIAAAQKVILGMTEGKLFPMFGNAPH